MESNYDRAVRLIEQHVAELNEALGLDPQNYSNRVSFGYIGNDDDVLWSVFLPHPGRVGKAEDRIGSFRTGDDSGARATLAALAGAVTGARLAGRVAR